MTQRRRTEPPVPTPRTPTRAPVVIKQAPTATASEQRKRTTLPYLGAGADSPVEADSGDETPVDDASKRPVSEIRGRYAIIHGRDKEAATG